MLSELGTIGWNLLVFNFLPVQKKLKSYCYEIKLFFKGKNYVTNIWTNGKCNC
jgi:hypothetical protein